MSRKLHLVHRVSHERWLVSYADFVTLLFAFFVVLFASGRADQIKQRKVSKAIDSAFQALGLFTGNQRKPGKVADSPQGTDAAVLPMNIVMGEDVLAPAQVRENLQQVQREMEQLLSDKVADHTVSIHMGQDGLVISLREAGFFASGSAIPKPQTVPTVERIAEALGKTGYNLRIEGHTDNIPIHTAEFDSNWELSSARATHIARIFLSLGSMEPARISVAGYGEFHPAASNDTAEGRAQNRRVDLVVIPRSNLNISAGLPGNPSSLPSESTPWRRITDDDQ